MSGTLRSFIWPSVSSVAVAVAALCASPASAAPTLPEATDLGPTPASDAVTVSLVLKVKHPELLEAFVALSQEPSTPAYHRFLSVREFADRFSPTPTEIA